MKKSCKSWTMTPRRRKILQQRRVRRVWRKKVPCAFREKRQKYREFYRKQGIPHVQPEALVHLETFMRQTMQLLLRKARCYADHHARRQKNVADADKNRNAKYKRIGIEDFIHAASNIGLLLYGYRWMEFEDLPHCRRRTQHAAINNSDNESSISSGTSTVSSCSMDLSI